MNAEKIITSLKVCSCAGSCGRCYRNEERENRYMDSTFNICDCKNLLMRDAIALIEEQKKQLAEWEKYTGFLVAHGAFDLIDDGK